MKAAATALPDPAHRLDLSIVIPTYQEADNLLDLVPAVAESIPSTIDWELIVVDDGSDDGTEQVIAAHASRGYPVRLIVRRAERGLSSAVMRGFDEAQGSVLVCMDGDFSHPPDRIHGLLEAFTDPTTDFALGSRYVAGASTESGWGVLRWLNSRMATAFARPLTRVKDPMSGFFGLRREAYLEARQKLNPIGYKIGLELLVKTEARVVRELPIRFGNRRHGESKLTLKEQWRYLKHVKRLLDHRYGWFSRFVQFALAGASGMALDLAVLATLLDRVPYPAARAVSIGLAMTWNFAVNRRMTFNDRRSDALLGQYWRFVLSCSVGASISWAVSNALVMYVLTGRPLLAALPGIAAGTLANFGLSSRWVFRRRGMGRE